MFQYAFARSLALNNNTGIQISRRFLNHDTLGRNYSLDKLSIPDVKFMTRFQEFKAHAKLYLMRKIHGKSFHSDKFIYFNARDYDYYEPALLTRNYNSAIICGYFQSWKYFQEHDFTIKNELRVSKRPSPDNEAKINEITSCESVCVHVRRGVLKTGTFAVTNIIHSQCSISQVKLIRRYSISSLTLTMTLTGCEKITNSQITT